ncbi:glycosyltransferase family 2 protein [Marinicrinis lubricantis]|uniref:Glycosyltransferase family 2 protein n=1 Tax=Marinicrinis lubricantis TaxID=2086470 RepID=A0ABW1IUI2_9BACL
MKERRNSCRAKRFSKLRMKANSLHRKKKNVRSRPRSHLQLLHQLRQNAFRDGKIDGILSRPYFAEPPLSSIQECWLSWLDRNQQGIWTWDVWKKVSESYMRGFETAYGLSSGRLLRPTTKSVAAIVTVMNEETTLPPLLRELDRFSPDELIIVVNGSTDNSHSVASQHPNARIVYYEQALGHDVGRAVGAMASSADILLFLDGDITVDAEELLPFIYAIEQGTDIALNDLTPYIGMFHQRDGVSIVKEFLNRSLGRADLSVNSMTAVPHAMSRKALDVIGCHMLMVPPKAQSVAIMNGLIVGHGGSVNVFQKNRQRETNQGQSNLVADLIIGDHMEALHTTMKSGSPRFNFADSIRKRHMITGGGLT